MPEIIQGLGQFRAGLGKVVTDWCDTREDALAEYERMVEAGEIAEYPAFMVRTPRTQLTIHDDEVNQALEESSK